MSATFRSATTGTATGTSVTANAPGGLAQGDQMLALVMASVGSVSLSAPSGWQLALGGIFLPANLAFSVFQKVATASEPASYTFTSSASRQLSACIVDYSGGVLDAAAQNDSSSAASLAGAPVTTTQATETVVAMWCEAAGAGAGITLPGGLTGRASVTGYGTQKLCLNVGDYAGPGSPGASSPGTATGDTAAWGCFTACLKTIIPAAPTLLSPANGSYSDVQSNGGPFVVQYNSGGSAGGETQYHFRRKLSGGSYNYWNAGTPAFQSSDVANVSTSTQLTFAASVWTDNNVYNWSWASVDVGGTGPYAPDFVLNAQATPAVTISAPTGTWATNQTPTVTWSDSLATGGSQLTYRVVTYSAAQYTASGFTPGSGPSLDDSGVVNSSATSYTIQNAIPQGTACESYVQIGQSPGGQLSPWTFTSFTVSVDSPATPTITAVPGNDPTTGCPVMFLTVQGYDNYLTANQSSLVAGNTTGWTAGGGTTLSAVSSPAPPTGVSSTFVMKLAGSGTLSALTPTGLSGIPVNPSTQYTALANFRSASTARVCTVAITWYDVTGTLISTVTSTGVNDSSTAWTQALETVTSPSNAAFATVTVSVAAAAENHFVSEVGFMPGTVSGWTMGGFVGSTTCAILRSDGLYVREASSADPLIIPSSTQSVAVNDYEATPTTNYTYAAVVSIVLGGVTGTLSSLQGVSPSAMIPGGQGFWEVDPLNPSSAVNSNPTNWNPSQIEQSAAHPVLSQTTANVVASAIQAPDLTATFEVFTAAIYQGLIALANSQKTIFISDPFGLSYYFRLALAPGGMSSGTGSTTHSTQTQPSSAAGPHRVVQITGIAQPRPLV